MRKFLLFIGVLIALAIPLGVLAPAASAAPATPDPVAVTTDPARVSTVLGARFTLHTKVTNTGSSASGPLLAHLNVASITGDVYVDPEDWSSNRSQDLSPLQPGQSRELSWPLQAVNSGSFAVYVVVLPYGKATQGSEPLVVSPLVRLQVATRSTLSAGGALPIALAVPLLLGLGAAGVRLRARRRS